MSTKLSIYCTGNGPALVLLHGWALHGGVFNPLVERLASQFHVFVVDLPGHGLNRNKRTLLHLPTLVSTIARATPPAIWCGWSLGGLLALHAASFLPQVRGLIMLAATPCFVRHEQWPDAMEPAVFDAFRHGLIDNTPRTIERFLALNVKGSSTARTSLRYLHQVLSEHELPPLNSLIQYLDLLRFHDLRTQVAELVRPNVWIGGEYDHLIPSSALHQAAALVKNAQASVHILPGCAHVPFIDEPDTVAQLICNVFHTPTV